jgi:uncharacterized protein with HEPN domain
MSKRTPNLLIEDIIESCYKIIGYTKDISFNEFIADTKTIDAVIRNFEIIGEAADRLPEEFKDLHQNIDWYRIRGFRNRIVHDYFGIDYSIVWQIKETYLPLFIKNLEKLSL